MTIEQRYKQAMSTDIAGLTGNVARKFAFTLAALAGEYAHGRLYDIALDDITRGGEPFASLFFGTPMWDNLVLDPDDKNLRIDMVLMTVSMTRNIVKTQIQGIDGTVKEYISDGDYSVNITGGLFSESADYPDDAVNKLLSILKLKTQVKVTSKFLQQFGINHVVFNSYRFDAKEGQNNAQFFELNADSDISEELIFNPNDKNKPYAA